MDDERVEAADGRCMSKVGGQRESHRDVDGCHGQRSHEITTQERPMILSNPIEKRNIVGYVSAIDSSVTILEAGYESARNT